MPVVFVPVGSEVLTGVAWLNPFRYGKLPPLPEWYLATV
jgi:hypothetical protein